MQQQAATAATQPTEVGIDRDTALTIVWADAHRTRIGLPELREQCPCAHCTEQRRSGTAVAAAKGLRVTGAELVGAWGLALAWSDGHDTGVYRWEVLRSWCGCRTCLAAR